MIQKALAGLTDDERSFINETIEAAKVAFSLERFDIFWRVEDSDTEDDDYGDSVDTLMTTCVLFESLEARIRIYPAGVKVLRKDRERFTHWLYHEVAHILLEPIAEFAYNRALPQERIFLRERTEQIVQIMARVARKTKAEVKYAKEAQDNTHSD